MRIQTAATTAAISTAILVLSACSSAPQSSAVGLPQTEIASHRLQPATGSLLYVADYSKNSIELLQHDGVDKWTNVGSIKESVDQPLSVWVDKNQNLYVANGNAPVTQYDSAGKLIFEYGVPGSGRGVTTDAAGNVFVADRAGSVSEYPQGDNNPFSCSVQNFEPVSVAVDKGGDVFVGLFTHRARGRVVEYVHGLLDSRCRATRIPVRLPTAPYGIAIDKDANLLVGDSGGRGGVGDIDVIAPPYTSITRTLEAGVIWPSSVTIDEANTRVYVSESSRADVAVLDYPAGARIATLGSGENLIQPVSAAANNNYVP